MTEGCAFEDVATSFLLAAGNSCILWPSCGSPQKISSVEMLVFAPNSLRISSICCCTTIGSSTSGVLGEDLSQAGPEEGGRCWQPLEGSLPSVGHVSRQEPVCTHTSAFPRCPGSSCGATGPWCSLYPAGACHGRAQSSARWPCRWPAPVSITAL